MAIRDVHCHFWRLYRSDFEPPHGHGNGCCIAVQAAGMDGNATRFYGVKP